MNHQPRVTADILPEEIHTTLGRIRHLAYPVQGETSDVVFVESTAVTTLPIPAVYTLVERHTSNGDEGWLVMVRLPGQPLQLVLGSEHNSSVRHRLLRGFGELLGSIHRCPLPASATLDQPWLETMLLRWAGGAVGDPRYDLALATQPRPEAFQSPTDLEAFYDGYSGPPIIAETEWSAADWLALPQPIDFHAELW